MEGAVKVLHIISTNALAGTEHYLVDLIKNASSDVDLAVVCPPDGQLCSSLASLDLPVIQLNFKLSNVIPTTFQLYLFLKKWHPKVVHTHLGKATLAGVIAAKFARVENVVSTLHFIKPAYVSTHSKLLYPFFLIAHMVINLGITSMIAISQAVRDEAIRREKINPKKIQIIQHGTSFQPVFLSKEAKQAAKKALGFCEEIPIVITVARLEREKGHKALIMALPKILQAYPQVLLLWIGNGDLRPELEAELDRMDLSDKVRLLGFQKDIANLLSIADIFLLPAPAEPFGLAILEAMASGLPVIAINAGGPSEIVVEGVTGRLVEYRPEAIAGAVCELLDNPEKAAAMGQAGKERCAAHFNIRRMVEQTEELYFSLLAASRVKKRAL